MQAPAWAAATRAFYGWRVAAAAALSNLISTGLVIWTLGVFVYPLELQFGWTRAEISLATSISFVVAGVAGPFVGRLNDWHGSRPLMLVGTLVLGLGFVSLTWVNSLWQLYLGFAVAALGRNATGYISLGALMANWFSRRRGVALGIATAGGSLGGAVLVPIASALVDSVGWRSAFMALGLAAWIVALPAIALFVRSRPADLGLTPDGLPPVVQERTTPAQDAVDWTVEDALRTATFWFLTIALGLAFATNIAVTVHLVPYLIGEGLTPASAAALAGVSAAFTTAGRFLMGWAADRFGSARRVLMGSLALQGLALVMLVGIRPDSPLIWLVFLLYGLGAGAPAVLETALTAESFGLRGLGSIMGVMGIFMTVALVAAPVLAGLSYDVSHSYAFAFIALAATCLVAAGATVLARPVVQPVPGRSES